MAGPDPRPGPSPRAYDVVKRAVDVAVSATGLVLSAPVQLVTAAVIRTTMGAPVLFRQDRPGRDGVIFELVKFRTMRHPDATHVTDTERLTAVGRFLRASSLDELPTLYNPEQARRHEVRPGITGLAQVSGRNAVGWEERFALDVAYVDSRSLRLDARILWRTIATVVRRDGISAVGEATMSPFTGSQQVGGARVEG